jgi:RNA 3'-terminal phosphate cyclase (ATP)
MALRLPVEIDGSLGEGGGQVVRTALALAVITGRKLRLRNIRAGRGNPGLQRQHLACVEAAAELCDGSIKAIGGGALAPGATTLEFAPAASWASELSIDIGTAGSTTLVVQTLIVPALVASDRPLRAVITGGTHNPLAPPFEFLDRVFVPQLRAMGADVTVTLERHGMMPEGNGRIVLETRPSTLRPIALVETGAVVARRATAIVAKLPRHVADRELAVACDRLREPTCAVVELPDDGPHNVFMVEAELASGVRELTTSHGRKGYPAELVARDALDDLVDYLEAGVPVGDYLADQLLLPMAVAGGGRFRTTELSPHATTNIATIGAFLDVPIRHAGDDVIDVVVGEHA